MSFSMFCRTLIPALDVNSLVEMSEIVGALGGIEQIGAFKVPANLAIGYGLQRVVDTIHGHSDAQVVYDQQKAGTDIPDTASSWAGEVAIAGIDAVILFPLTGPKTQRAWIEAALGEGLGVIVGGEMTHPGYLASEGGYIADDAPDRIYDLAIELGVTDFVIPGNRIERVKHHVEHFTKRLGAGNFVCYSPGLVTQGGDITEAGQVAGQYWHAIVGRGIYQAEDPAAAARAMCAQLALT